MEDQPAKLSGNIVDVVKGRIFPGVLELSDGRIHRIQQTDQPFDHYLLPGFVDAHIHIESSLLTPAEFARLAVGHGTIACVSDPHEIANVLGVEGVHYMLEEAQLTPLKIMFGAPSCVPATSFETAGARLDAAAVEALLADPRIGYLSEVMNVPAVLAGEAEMMRKLAAAGALGKPLDGHAPGLRGKALAGYRAAGITTDHESVSLEEAAEKLALGMKVMIREGSAARNFDRLAPLLAGHADDLFFCSDDKHPDELLAGHVDALVRRGLKSGVDLMTLLRVASLNPIRHYGLPVGLLQPGDPADLIVVEDLQELTVKETIIDGVRVFADGRARLPAGSRRAPNRFEAAPLTTAELATEGRGRRVRVIEVQDGQLVTTAATEILQKGEPEPERDLLKLAVVNRYAPARPALAFVRGFGLQRGAIASSVAHDSHNLIAVGASDEELCRALNLVVAHQGGLSWVDGGQDDILPLPVAGLMSYENGFEVAERYSELSRHARVLGCGLRSPYMTLSFLALLVIPELKLSDKGLFDGRTFELVDLYVPSGTAARPSGLLS
ncbi:MAG TPA: adenine deaminase [Trueperaceae bacterium]